MSSRKQRWIVPVVAALFWISARVPALACAVCFGSDGPSGLARGFFWGILLLLILPFSMLAGLVAWIAYATRKKSRENLTAAGSPVS
jgi:hypothetical protein